MFFKKQTCQTCLHSVYVLNERNASVWLSFEITSNYSTCNMLISNHTECHSCSVQYVGLLEIFLGDTVGTFFVCLFYGRLDRLYGFGIVALVLYYSFMNYYELVLSPVDFTYMKL